LSLKKLIKPESGTWERSKNLNLCSRSFFAEDLPILTPLDDDGDAAWLHELIAAAREKKLIPLADLLADERQKGSFFGALMTLSPFLRDILINHPHFLEPLRLTSLEFQLEDIIRQITKLDEEADLTESLLMRRLRQFKKQAALMIALGDLSQLFDLAETTRFLSRVAEAVLGCALRFLLRQAQIAGQIKLPNPQNPESGCGLVLLGLGKLGAYELNYSSDIDLIAFIDETSPAIIDITNSVDVFSKLMRRLVRILQERTEEGYAFRVDLRLRPDPSSTPLALPFEAALHYYESRGQNWERAAFIKARSVAGDTKAGEKLLKELEPYIWRKYLDYAAISDIVAIKNQIHSLRNVNGLVLRGANVKLGVGGIREIEFFVQIQQLIAGGRLPQLRGRSTMAMLDALYDAGWITLQARDELRKNYIFLRRVEHCIQMVADEQSHILPEDDLGFLTIARLMSYHDSDAFCADLTCIMQQVEGHFRALMKNETEDEIADFTLPEADPSVLEKLSKFGFIRLGDIYRIIHSWYIGQYRATQSAQARARLRQLMPALLSAIAATKRSDETLLQFDSFLRNLPAGIQLFSLLHSNKGLLDMLVLIMGAAPRLAEIITRKPHIFDGMLDPTLFSELPNPTQLKQRLTLFLDQASHYEEKLDRLRIFASEQHFLIGLRMLGRAINTIRAGQAFSDLADLMIERTLVLVTQEFMAQHGMVEGGKIAILGLGKLGSRELRSGSDVDLILLYEHDEAFEMSDGKKPLYVSQYYTRLTQRLMAALSAPTAEGVLYQVDMRLRPSGNKGPVAVPFSSFSRYQRKDAWIWEHMALTRARPIAGDSNLCARTSADINAILASSHPHKALIEEIAAMRQRIAIEKQAQGFWDVKHCDGGIIELEFIAQYAILSGAVSHHDGQTTGDILAALPEAFCLRDERQSLCQAFFFYTDLSQMLSLCLEGESDLEKAPSRLIDQILAITAQADLARLRALHKDLSATVHALFTRLFF